MRVLIAPDCFTGTLTAVEAAEAIAEGWLAAAPEDRVELCPLSDGGPGFLEVLTTSLGPDSELHRRVEGSAAALRKDEDEDGDGDTAACRPRHERPGASNGPDPASGGAPEHVPVGVRVHAVTVTGPTGTPTAAQLLVHTGADGVLTAYAQTAQACGAHLVPAADRDPRRTGTGGVGDLLRHARALGARRIVLGLGGSGTNDAGAGMLLSLATAEGLIEDSQRTAHLFGSGGGVLRAVTRADLAFLEPLKQRWQGIDLVAATDVDCPLLGPGGASRGFSPQKGATPEQAQELEDAVGTFAGAADPTGALADHPGAGAAGGLGFGLLLLGAQRTPGADTVLSAVGFDERLRDQDLVITGEGKFDWQSLRGKVVSAVATTAADAGVRVVVLAGQVGAMTAPTQALASSGGPDCPGGTGTSRPQGPSGPSGTLGPLGTSRVRSGPGSSEKQKLPGECVVCSVVPQGGDPAQALVDPRGSLARAAHRVALEQSAWLSRRADRPEV